MTNENTTQRSIFIADHTGQFYTHHVNYLNTCGFNVVTANNKESAFRKYHKAQPGIVLIHEEFPQIDLQRIIKLIHSCNQSTPIILIVSNPEKVNVVAAFYQSVSDCITIDINPIILAQRIQRSLTTLAPEKPKIPLGRSLFLPHDSQILCHNEEWIDLLPKENELLLLLCNKQGGISSKEELIKALWGQKNQGKQFHHSHWHMNLDSLIYSLKKKLINLSDIHIVTIKKIGYRICIAENVWEIRIISELFQN